MRYEVMKQRALNKETKQTAKNKRVRRDEKQCHLNISDE